MQNNLFTISKEICDTKKYLIKVGHDLTGLIVHYCLKPMSWPASFICPLSTPVYIM